MSLPFSLRLLIPVLLVLFSVVVGYYDVRQGSAEAQRRVEDEALQALAERMTSLQSTFEYLLRERQFELVEREIAALGVDEDLQAALLAGDHGAVLASLHFADLNVKVEEVLPELPAADAAQRTRYMEAAVQGHGVQVYLADSGRAVIGVYPLLLGAARGELRPTRNGVLYLQRDLTRLKALQLQIAERRAMGNVLFWCTLALVIWIMAHFLVTRRMAQMLRATQRLAGGDTAARSGVHGRDELGAIGRAFDRMAGQLGEQQARLQQSRERLDLALKAARMITWETARDSGEVIWSDNLDEVLGGAQPDPARRTEITQTLLPMIRSCSTDEVEERITLSDGGEFWLACRGKVYPAGQGGAQRLSGVIWDVTERRHATDALHMLAQARAVDDETTFYRHCVTALARAFGVRIAFVGVFADERHESIRTLAVRHGDGFMENFSYRLEGTPCRDILACERELIPCNVRRLYPDDHMLVEIGAESYYGLPLRSEDGATHGLVAIIDTRPMELKPWTEALLGIFAARITHELERKRAREQLYEEKERAEVTLHSIGDAVITTDDEGRVQYLNPVAEQLTGWRNDEARGRPLREVFVIINELTREPALDPVARCLRDGRVIALANHTVLIARNGLEIAIEDSAAPIRNRGGNIIGVVMVFHDVTQARAMAQQLSWQATHDALTGLINRREFETRLNMALSEARSGNHRHALLYLDLDQFKVVNDTCGHVAGDELLKQLASLLHSRLREGDTLARLGGDELGVLLSFCPEEQAHRIAEILRQTVKEYRFNWEGKSFEIGASIGLVIIDADCVSVAELLSAADMACYAAKDAGRNRIHVYRRGDKQLAQRHGEMQWVNRISRAVEENRLVLYRQRILPIMGADEDCLHYEVLIRMRGEDGDIIPPGAFLPAAERYGLMPVIDRWVIRTLFATMAGEEAVSGGCAYAVNLSGASLNDEKFHDFVREELRRHDIAPGRICFEITETAAIANLPRAARFIREMKEIGCRFSLDDFGSGVSSFAYLKNLPVDNLKIDGSFVKDIVDDPIDYAMVQAINQIGHVMGLRTTAEFVENDAILERLRAIGVDYAQGYGIDRPQPFVGFEPPQINTDQRS